MINPRHTSVKILILTILVSFFFTFGFPSHQLIASYHMQDAMAQQAYFAQHNTQQNEQHVMAQSGHNAADLSVLGQLAEQLATEYNALERGWEQRDYADVRRSIQSIQKEVKEAKKALVQEWKEHEKVLQQAGSSVGKRRLKEKRAEIDDQFATLEATLEEVATYVEEVQSEDKNKAEQTQKDASEQASADEQWAQKLNALKDILAPEVPHELLGNELPHRQFDAEPETVILGEDMETAQVEASATDIDYTELAEPTDADLQETIETTWTEEIVSLADDLGNDPLAIYEFVRHEIDFQPYYGSRKGAFGTFEQRSGNDLDQASLLISLLRYHDIPARYAHGTVEIPIERAMNWVGAETPEAAAKILASLGTPVRSIISGGEITAIQKEHVWVEAYVPYDEYRGIGERSGSSTWVPLDPTFVQKEYVEGLDLERQLDVDFEAVFEQVHLGSERSGDGLTTSRVPGQILLDSFETEYDRLLDYAEATLPDDQGNFVDVTGGWVTVDERLGFLPLSLPYSTTQVKGTFSVIPDQLAETVRFTIQGGSPFQLNWNGALDFDYINRAAELYGKKITLSWEPATEDDEQVIEAYGGLFETPVYLIKLTPELKIDGQTVASGEPVGAGYRQAFNIHLSAPGIGTEKAENTVTTGGYYAVGLDFGSVSSHQLEGLQKRMEAVSQTANETSDPYSEGIMGEVLHGIVQTYLSQVQMSQTFLSGQHKIHFTHLLGETTTGYEPQVKYFLLSPVQMSQGGLFVDVNRNVLTVNSFNGNEAHEKAFMVASGMMGSALEHHIFEQTVGVPSVSTIKLFQIANERGIPTYTVTEENIDRVLPKLNVSSIVKQDILSAIDKGHHVTIPGEDIQFFDWKGTAYIVLDPETGAAAYRIGGGINGGSTAFIIDLATIITILDAMIGILTTGVLILSGGPATAIGLILGLGMYFYAAHLNSILEDYYRYGNEEAGEAIISEAKLAIAFFMIPYLPKLFRAAKANIDQLISKTLRFIDESNPGIVHRFAEEGFSDAHIYMLAQNSGTKELENIYELASDLRSLNVNHDVIEIVSRNGIEDLQSLKSLLNDGINMNQIESFLTDGIRAEDILYITRHGIQPEAFIQYGIRNSEQAKSVVELIRGHVALDDIRFFANNEVTPSQLKHLVQNLNGWPSAKRLITDYSYTFKDIRRAYLIDTKNIDDLLTLENTTKADGTKRYPYVRESLGNIEDLGKKFTVKNQVTVEGSPTGLLSEEMANRISRELLDRSLTIKQLQDAAIMRDYRNRKGIVGEAFTENIAKRVLNLDDVKRDVDIVVNGKAAQLDVIGVDNQNLILFESRNYAEGSFNRHLKDTAYFEEGVLKDIRRLGIAVDKYKDKQVVFTYIFTDDYYDPRLGDKLIKAFKKEGYQINIIHWRYK
ncbi:transglutaminase domain-containing protein [Caldalkalibacillus salinus]|uniref:transglutaminase domain-containing protein n=1 Tax=Caldalkalibacillus salinus TaxID=2803787 RepID=UPI0019216163|nr:transglutaminase domain-containing protein [Caldalkalibacillus salinus]